MNTELSKGRKITGWVLAGLLTALFLFSAMGKFSMAEMAENFNKWGLAEWITIIAIGEILVWVTGFVRNPEMLAKYRS